jgi:hypothetical protein
MTMGPGEVAEQERIATSLVGHCLTGVTYVSLGVEGREQTWDGPGGDSVDFGIDLDFDGQPLSVGWIPPTGAPKGYGRRRIRSLAGGIWMQTGST